MKNFSNEKFIGRKKKKKKDEDKERKKKKEREKERENHHPLLLPRTRKTVVQKAGAHHSHKQELREEAES